MNVAVPNQTAAAPLDGRTTRLDLAVLMLGAFVLYAINVNFVLYGDAALYSDYVVLRKFDEVTVHLGYYLLLFVADKLLGGLGGIPIQESAVWLNVTAGTLSVGVAYLLALKLLGTRRDAVLCAVIFGLSGRVFANSTTSEMYMVQTLFVLSSFYLFTRERVAWSGLLAAVALMVSPLSIFAYLFYPVYDYQRAGKIRWSVYVRLTAWALVLYLPFFIMDGREMLFGIRGLLKINNFLPFNPATLLWHIPLYQFKAFTVLPFLLVPMLFAWRQNRRNLVLALAVCIPHAYLMVKLTGEDYVFILNTDFFVAYCLVIGWRQLEKLKIGRWIGPILLLAHAGIFVLSGTIHSFQPHRGYADEMRRVAKTYLWGRDSILVTDWGRAGALSFYGRPQPTTTILNEPLFRDQMFDIEAQPPEPLTKLNRPEIFLLDPWEPTPLNRYFRSKAEVDQLVQEHSIVAIAARQLHLRCSLIEETEHRLYRCVREQP
jgi:hypothetical protein